MKVILVNGSPKPKGTTYHSLLEVAGQLEAAGIETEIFQVGVKPISGCIGCGGCRETHRCVLKTDTVVNEFIDKIEGADGFVFGSPVHYASMSGHMTSFMDRAFYAGSGYLRGKPVAGIAVARRGGISATLDQMNKYLSYAETPLITSQYWNMVHGHNGEQAQQDLEGMQTMRVLGRNMAWMLKCLEAGRNAGIQLPEQEERHWTNFIR